MNTAVRLYAQKYRDLTPSGREQVLLARLKDELPRSWQTLAPTLLDLGCGAGHLTAGLSELGYRVLGVDSSADMLQEARRLYPNLTFAYGDMTSYTPIAPVNVVVCLGEVLNYLGTKEALARTLQHLASILEPGGKLIAEMLDPQDICVGWDGTTQVFPFADGWTAIFDYAQLDRNRGRWDCRWLRRLDSGPEAESHGWSVILQTWTVEEMIAELRGAGFDHVRAIDMWRGGTVREETVSQLISAERD